MNTLHLHLGCVPIRWSGSGSVIQSVGSWYIKVKMNPLWSRIHRLLSWSEWSWVIDQLYLSLQYRRISGAVKETRFAIALRAPDHVSRSCISRSGSHRTNKTRFGLRPIDKTWTGSEKKSDHYKFLPKWSLNISWSSFGLEMRQPFFAAQWSKVVMVLFRIRYSTGTPSSRH